MLFNIFKLNRVMNVDFLYIYSAVHFNINYNLNNLIRVDG